MRQKTPVTEDTFIRQLPYGVQKHFSSLLDIDNHWERFVVRVPRKLHDLGKPDCEKRYSQLQIKLFAAKIDRPDGSPTRSILGEKYFSDIYVDLTYKMHLSLFLSNNPVKTSTFHRTYCPFDISRKDIFCLAFYLK